MPGVIFESGHRVVRQAGYIKRTFPFGNYGDKLLGPRGVDSIKPWHGHFHLWTERVAVMKRGGIKTWSHRRLEQHWRLGMYVAIDVSTTCMGSGKVQLETWIFGNHWLMIFVRFVVPKIEWKYGICFTTPCAQTGCQPEWTFKVTVSKVEALEPLGL